MANNRTLTSANAILMLAVSPVWPVATRIKGFAADDVTNIDAVDTAETVMGVDGRLSAGFVPAPLRQTITLQADSTSNDFFEEWYRYEVQNREKLVASGQIVFRGTQRTYICTRGFLRNYSPIPAARRILQPRTFTIEWERVASAPNL